LRHDIDAIEKDLEEHYDQQLVKLETMIDSCKFSKWIDRKLLQEGMRKISEESELEQDWYWLHHQAFR